MDCSCRSKELYRAENSLTFKVGTQQVPQTRKRSSEALSHQFESILQSMYEASQVFLPTVIHKISMEELYTNPLWFYKNYISANKPCIIEDAIDCSIIEKWENPR
jgi:hypothetical protein